MSIRLRSFIIFVIALVAEIGSSLWLWLRAPTDTVRVWYEGNFLAYEAVRIVPWLVIFAVCFSIYFLLSRKAKND